MMRIGEWKVDVEGNRLLRGRRTVRIEPKAMGVLRALHARAGGLLSKEELIREVWGEVAVSDEVLTTAVYQLRRALGDDHRAPRYIETVPRRGYRLIAGEPRRRFGWQIAAAAVTMVIVVAIGVAHGERRAAGELRELGMASLLRAEHREAARLLSRAAELDPRDATIAGSLALALSFDDDSVQAARAAAARALALDRTNPHALTARGIVSLWSEWNWDAALRDLRLASRSGDPAARAWLAYVSLLAGDPAVAQVALPSPDERPLVAIPASTTHLLRGDLDAAERALAPALRRHPRNVALLRQAEKIEQRRRGIDAEPLDDATALTSLERAFAARDHHVLYLRVDSRWASIRQHPRFQSIAAAVGP